VTGRGRDPEGEITGLKVRDAYWAGAVAVVILLVKLLIG